MATLFFPPKIVLDAIDSLIVGHLKDMLYCIQIKDVSNVIQQKANVELLHAEKPG
ncbi:MAG TPA: hypothetical protein VN954_07865 [Ktedonobacteraceae bacterium]|nr:hypothetical protein [Ktedonobacteraceae bacterium]